MSRKDFQLRELKSPKSPSTSDDRTALLFSPPVTPSYMPPTPASVPSTPRSPAASFNREFKGERSPRGLRQEDFLPSRPSYAASYRTLTRDDSNTSNDEPADRNLTVATTVAEVNYESAQVKDDKLKKNIRRFRFVVRSLHLCCRYNSNS
jgi:hypothetical protein